MERKPWGHSCSGGRGTSCLFIQEPTLLEQSDFLAALSRQELLGMAGETHHGPLRPPPLSHLNSLLPLVQPHLPTPLAGPSSPTPGSTCLPRLDQMCHLRAPLLSGCSLYQLPAQCSVIHPLLPHRSPSTRGLQSPCGQVLSVPSPCMPPGTCVFSKGSLSIRPDS